MADRQEQVGGQGAELKPEEKLIALQKLGDKRRAFSAPEGCLALADFHGGYYECEFVSPWTLSARNVDAQLAIVLQDWCGSDYLAQPIRPQLKELGHDPALATNINLKRLLAVIGLNLDDVFGTNAFPFVKRGKMSSKVEGLNLDRTFSEFVLPQIEIVGPTLVVLFGKAVYNSACRVLGAKSASNLAMAIASPIHFRDVTYVASVHPGSKIGIHRGWQDAFEDWRVIGEMLR